MIIVPVKTLKQALQMRIIRNECRLFMTGDTSTISLLRQIWWYYTKYKFSKSEAYLMYINDKAIGYGFIKDGYLTLGLLKKYRGKGYGKQLLEFLIKKAKKLKVLATNTRALQLYLGMGFTIKVLEMSL